MATVKRNRPQPSGRHVTPRRKISATLEQFVAMDRVAVTKGLTWGQWALAILLAKVKHKQTASERARVQKARL